MIFCLHFSLLYYYYYFIVNILIKTEYGSEVRSFFTNSAKHFVYNAQEKVTRCVCEAYRVQQKSVH